MLGFLSLNIDYPEVKQIRIQDNTIKVFDDNLLIDFDKISARLYTGQRLIHNITVFFKFFLSKLTLFKYN